MKNDLINDGVYVAISLRFPLLFLGETVSKLLLLFDAYSMILLLLRLLIFAWGTVPASLPMYLLWLRWDMKVRI